MCVSNNLLSPTVLYSCSYKTFPFGELIVNAFLFPIGSDTRVKLNGMTNEVMHMNPSMSSLSFQRTSFGALWSLIWPFISTYLFRRPLVTHLALPGRTEPTVLKIDERPTDFHGRNEFLVPDLDLKHPHTRDEAVKIVPSGGGRVGEGEGE